MCMCVCGCVCVCDVYARVRICTERYMSANANRRYVRACWRRILRACIRHLYHPVESLRFRVKGLGSRFALEAYLPPLRTITPRAMKLTTCNDMQQHATQSATSNPCIFPCSHPCLFPSSHPPPFLLAGEHAHKDQPAAPSILRLPRARRFRCSRLARACTCVREQARARVCERQQVRGCAVHSHMHAWGVYVCIRLCCHMCQKASNVLECVRVRVLSVLARGEQGRGQMMEQQTRQRSLTSALLPPSNVISKSPNGSRPALTPNSVRHTLFVANLFLIE